MPAFHAIINASKNEVQQLRLQNLASDPSSPVEGQFYYNTGSKKPRWYDGTAWQEIGSGGGTVTSFSAGNLSPLFTTSVATATSTPALTFSLSNAAQNAVFAGPSSGGAGAPTFRSLVQADIPNTIPLSYWATATANINMGGFKITNAADGSANTDYVTLQQMNAAIAGQKKTSVRGATVATLTITARTTTTLTVGGTSLVLDGVTYANGDTILVKDNTTGVAGAGAADNGKYVVSGVGSSILLTRSADMDAASEVDGQYVVIEDGTTLAGTIWLTVSEVTTLGTDTITWTKVNQATDLVAGAGLVATGLTFDIVATNTSLTVNANDIGVNLATNSGLQISSGLKIQPDTTTANTIGLTLTSNGAGIIFNTTSFTDSGSETLALASTVAGAGLTLTSGVLDVVSGNTGIVVNANDITLTLATNSGLQISSGLKILSDTVTSNTLGITLTANGAGIKYDGNSFSETSETLTLAAGVAGAGLTLTTGVLSVTGYTPVASTTVARKYVTAITLAIDTYSQTVTHNLGTRDVQVWVYNTATNEWIITDVIHSTTTTVTISGVNKTGASISANCVVVG